MKLSKPIDFQNVEALSQALKAEKVSMVRFSLDVAERDAANGILAAMKAVVEYRCGKFIADADTRSHILQAARWLIDPNAKPGLMLNGLYGNGKTTLATAIAWLIGYLTEREYGGYSYRQNMKLYTGKDIVRMCAASERFRDNRDTYNGIFEEPMIIIDDLGEEPKELMVFGMIHTPIIDILSERYAQQRMTIATTNLTTDELKVKYGERIYDRLAEMMTTITFENDSYRLRKGSNQVDNAR